jgi:mannose-6-phosphate isomerase-like protein (cupin superfamily)
MQVLATADMTGGAYGLMVQEATRGFSPPLHRHGREEDAYLVLEGEVTFRLDGEDRQVGPGGFILLPRGIPHTFRVDTEQARWLEIVTPGGFEQWHLECSDPAGGPGLPPEAPPDIDRILRTIEPYGATIEGQPMEAP